MYGPKSTPMVSLNISSPPFAETLGFTPLPYSPPPNATGALPWPVAIPRRDKDQQRNDEGMCDQRDPCCLAAAIDRDNVIFFRQISREKMQTHLCRRDL